VNSTKRKKTSPASCDSIADCEGGSRKRETRDGSCKCQNVASARTGAGKGKKPPIKKGRQKRREELCRHVANPPGNAGQANPDQWKKGKTLKEMAVRPSERKTKKDRLETKTQRQGARKWRTDGPIRVSLGKRGRGGRKGVLVKPGKRSGSVLPRGSAGRGETRGS